MTETSSRTAWAEERLRSTIVSGELAPGARVRVEELAVRWQVSPTPLREAVRTLAGEGLITLRPQRGARVAEISAAEMQDLYATRTLLEPIVLRLSLERADEAWAGRLETSFAALEAVFAAGAATALGLEPERGAFHRALRSAAGSPSLLRMSEQLTTQSLRYEVLTSASPVNGIAEHRELFEAAVALDEQSVIALSTLHLGRTVKSTLGPAALETMVERVAHARGLAAPVLEALTTLV
jgi:GntR family transcriptional regulator, carbon starvation induced regulator